MLKVSRETFQVDTDTGTQTFVGTQFMGAIHQIGWNVETVDTGADLIISLQPGDGVDTGEGWTIYNNNDCLGTDFLQPLIRNAVHENGLDTGTGSAQAVIGMAGDRPFVRVVPGGAAVKGKLYIWTYAG